MPKLDEPLRDSASPDLMHCLDSKTPSAMTPQRKRAFFMTNRGRTVLAGGLLGGTLTLAGAWMAPVNAFGFAPLTVQVAVNRVWGSPTVDLPPQRQRPDLYAELSMLGEQVITPVEPTPRINEDVYPDWLMSAASERAWLDPGELIPISIRIFDEDEDEDDKVLFSTLFLDPYLCEITVGELAIAGAWVNDRSTCIVSIPDLRSETGSAALTVSAQWIGVNPGR
jgi:hypothetical protein